MIRGQTYYSYKVLKKYFVSFSISCLVKGLSEVIIMQIVYQEDMICVYFSPEECLPRESFESEEKWGTTLEFFIQQNIIISYSGTE